MVDEELVDKCTNSLTERVAQRPCSTLALRVPQGDSSPVAHTGGLLDNASLWLPSLPCLMSSLPHLCFLELPSPINYLHLSPHHKVCFWRDPNKILPKTVVSESPRKLLQCRCPGPTDSVDWLGWVEPRVWTFKKQLSLSLHWHTAGFRSPETAL